MLRRLWRRAGAARGAPSRGLDAAIALLHVGDAQRAGEELRSLVAAEPASAPAWLWLARACQAAGDDAGAQEAYAEAESLAGHPGEVARARGDSALLAGDGSAAAAWLAEACALLPDDADAVLYHARALQMAGRGDAAIQALEAAITRFPASAALRDTLGAVLHAERGLEGAAPAYNEAIAALPGNATLRYNFGVLCARAGDKARAIDLFREAITLAPDFGPARLNLGIELLHVGRYAEAYPWFEERWRHARMLRGGYTLDPARQWRGEPLAGRRLFLWAEQGLGDTLQMIRYLPLIAQRGVARLSARVPASLASLLAHSLAGVDWIAETAGGPAPPHDLHCPLMSLPAAFGTTLASIPAEIPYLRCPAERIAQWRARLPPPDGRLRAGLVWRSGRTGLAGEAAARRERDVPFALLAPLAGLRQIDWISLQVGAGRDEPARAAHPLRPHDAAGAISDFADTAAIIAQLEVVVTVDTAVAHLAAALGKPVILLLKHSGGLFWLRERGDSPWYPGVVRILRQARPGDWTAVIGRAAALLERMVAAPPGTEPSRHLFDPL
jgi:Tfp pilus assembly protein PilF